MNRAHRSLVVLTILDILAVGALAETLSGASSPLADVLTVADLLVLVITSTLLVRVLRYLTRHP